MPALPVDWNSAQGLTTGVAEQSWSSLSYSVYHDLLLPFGTPATSAIVQGLIYLPFLLFVLFLPFWQAGIIGTLQESRFGRLTAHQQFRAFFRGIGENYLYCWTVLTVLVPFYLLLFWLASSFGTVSPTWTVFQWAIYWLFKVSIILIALSYISFTGDWARLSITKSSCCFRGKTSPLFRLLESFKMAGQHFLSLFFLRGLIYGSAFCIVGLLYLFLMHWPGGGWLSLWTSFLVQQITIVLLIWARLYALVVMDEYMG
ncbi:hypothetical protein [Heliorestis convoluta]|uniref:hypothetical protein n=1 Tax=Heliorestis convoluta TaxID=356322 RepID=UPI00138940F1|nr:hypothetical protein [Heliorestis convoluta]